MEHTTGRSYWTDQVEIERLDVFLVSLVVKAGKQLTSASVGIILAVIGGTLGEAWAAMTRQIITMVLGRPGTGSRCEHGQ